MSADVLLKHFERISEARDAIPRLRRFILDLAVRGKLVDQDPKDEPATELLKRIEQEKTRLVKAGEIRKGKPLPPIDENGTLFKLPASWKWVPIRNITVDRNQKIPDKEFSYVDVSAIDKERGLIATPQVLTPDVAPSRARKIVQKGDVIYSCVRPYLLNIAVVEEEFNPEPIVSTAFAVLNGLRLVLPRYLWLVLRSPFSVGCVEGKMRGQAYPAINDGDFATLPFPLAPLAEQHRIVAKVDELMALCDELEAAQQKRERHRDRLVVATLHGPNNGIDGEAFRDSARFYINHLPCLTTRPEHIHQLRQTILNLAVRGKLVPQDPSDEPASGILNRIKTGNAQLFGAGKIKKDEPPTMIVDSDAPFELPPGWLWARFPELGTFERGKSKHRPRNDPSLFKGGIHLFVQTGDVARSNGVIETFTSKYNDVGLAQSAMWPKGTLCITIAANIADSGILGFDACFPDSVVGFIPASVFPNARYFEYFMRTAKADLLKFAPATAQKNINLGILNQVLIPLPPLAEQQRIVAKVDELMALCDELEARITTTTTRHQLLEATLNEVLSGNLEPQGPVL